MTEYNYGVIPLPGEPVPPSIPNKMPEYNNDRQVSNSEQFANIPNVNDGDSNEVCNYSKKADGNDPICQDFLRGVCFRTSCKFKHVNDDSVHKHYVFCRDYQRNRCTRIDCRFIHCSVAEEEHYKNTGELLPTVQDSFIRSRLGMPSGSGKAESNVQVCRDFLKGMCNRSNCKFLHQGGHDRDYFEPPPKRGRYNNNYDYDYDEVMCPLPPPPPGPRSNWELQSENDILRKQNEELIMRLNESMKQIENLQSTNDYLLDQTSEFRSRKGFKSLY